MLNNYSQAELFRVQKQPYCKQHYFYITLQSIVQTLPLEEARILIISLFLKFCIRNARNHKSSNLIYNYCVRSDHICVTSWHYNMTKTAGCTLYNLLYMYQQAKTLKNQVTNLSFCGKKIRVLKGQVVLLEIILNLRSTKLPHVDALNKFYS